MKRDRVLFYKGTQYIFLALVVFVLFAFVPVNAEIQYPKPTDLKYINDYTSTIDDATKEYIVSVGKELEDKTGAQEVVVVVDSLQGNDITTFANGLFRNWGIGQKGKDNGLLVLISIKDKKYRVEVGTSLEGAVTDIYSARVMDGVSKPKFQTGNYSEGIKSSYSIFADSIAKEYKITLSKNEKVTLPQQDKTAGSRTKGLIAMCLAAAFVILDFIFNGGRLTLFLISMMFWSGRGGGGNGSNGNNGGGYGGMGGGSSSGGGSSGSW